MLRRKQSQALAVDRLAALLGSPTPETANPEMARMLIAAATLRPGVRPRESWRVAVKARMLDAAAASFYDAPPPTVDAGSRDDKHKAGAAHHAIEAVDLDAGISAHLSDVETITPGRRADVMARLAAVLADASQDHQQP